MPAERVVWLASSATDGKTGLEVQVLTPRKQLAGALRELRRMLKREPARDTSVNVKLVAPRQAF